MDEVTTLMLTPVARSIGLVTALVVLVAGCAPTGPNQTPATQTPTTIESEPVAVIEGNCSSLEHATPDHYSGLLSFAVPKSLENAETLFAGGDSRAVLLLGTGRNQIQVVEILHIAPIQATGLDVLESVAEGFQIVAEPSQPIGPAMAVNGGVLWVLVFPDDAGSDQRVWFELRVAAATPQGVEPDDLLDLFNSVQVAPCAADLGFETISVE